MIKMKCPVAYIWSGCVGYNFHSREYIDKACIGTTPFTINHSPS